MDSLKQKNSFRFEFLKQMKLFKKKYDKNRLIELIFVDF